MRATWVTMAENDQPGSCSFKKIDSGNPTEAIATTHSYPDGGFKGTIHECVMKGLLSGQQYSYKVGSNAADAWSKDFTFRYAIDAASLSFISYGDMGVKNSKGTVAMAVGDALSRGFDLTVNVGDTSYADDNGPKGANSDIFDEHFNDIQVSRSEGVATKM